MDGFDSVFSSLNSGDGNFAGDPEIRSTDDVAGILNGLANILVIVIDHRLIKGIARGSFATACAVSNGRHGYSGSFRWSI